MRYKRFSELNTAIQELVLERAVEQGRNLENCNRLIRDNGLQCSFFIFR